MPIAIAGVMNQRAATGAAWQLLVATFKSLQQKHQTVSSKALLGRIHYFARYMPELQALKSADVLNAALDDIAKAAAKLAVSDAKNTVADFREKYGSRTRKGRLKLEKLPIGKPVLRVAPNPNYPPTLGNLKGIVINGHLAKTHNGTLILRFDDTDPVNKPVHPRAMQSYKRAFQYLDLPVNGVIRASERSNLYDVFVVELVSRGFAYVCHCTRQKFKMAKKRKSHCACAHNAGAIGLRHLAHFFNGALPGQCAVRISDATRADSFDWVGARVSGRGKFRRIRPTLNLQSALDDAVEGVTHIIRGKDLLSGARAQKKLYEKLGWTYPTCIYWGRNSVDGVAMRSSELARQKADEFHPMVPTFENLRCCGFSKQDILSFYLQDVGLTANDSSLNLGCLIAKAAKRAVNWREKDAGQRAPIVASIVKWLKCETTREIPRGLHVIMRENRAKWYSYAGSVYTCNQNGLIVTFKW